MTKEKNVTEWGNPATGLTLKITGVLHEEQTPYQHIQIVDTLQYGRMMILDGVFQTSVKDEWMYHEMIAHVPLMLHPNPQRVLIIGGGDGGCAREVCRHASLPPLTCVISISGCMTCRRNISLPLPAPC